MNEATHDLRRKEALHARRETLKAKLVRPRLDPAFEFTILVVPDDVEALMGKDVEGSGGRQSLLRAFQASIRRHRATQARPDRLTLSHELLSRAVDYWNGTGEDAEPGAGGDQALLPMQSFFEAGLIHPRPGGQRYREKGNLGLFG